MKLYLYRVHGFTQHFLVVAKDAADAEVILNRFRPSARWILVADCLPIDNQLLYEVPMILMK